MNAPDKHTTNMRRPAGPVLSPFEIPRDQEKGLTCGSQRQKQAKSKILVKTIRIQCWKQQKNPLYIFFGYYSSQVRHRPQKLKRSIV